MDNRYLKIDKNNASTLEVLKIKRQL